MKHLVAKLARISASGILILVSSQVLGQTANNGSTTLFSSASTLLGPSQTGQPSQTCGVTTPPNSQPGNSATAPGSAFNPASIADSVYAGTQPQNSKNTASVAQYDVACSKQPPK